MYGNVNNLDHVRSVKEGASLPFVMGAVLTENNRLVSGPLLFTKRDSAVLFSRMKRMSPKMKKLGMALNSGNGGRREWATMKLARIGEKASPLLSLTLAHGDPMARAASAEAYCRMVRLDITDSVSCELSVAVQDEAPYVRWRAIAEISKMGPKASRLIKQLFDGLNDQSDLVRAQAAKAIAATYKVPRKGYRYQEDIHDLKESITKENDRYTRGEMCIALAKVETENDRFNTKCLRTLGFKA
jgi:hypothetical protein